MRCVLGLVMVLLAAGCSGVDPAARAVQLEVFGCGDAFDGAVAGTVVGPEQVVTVAHGVAQADGIRVITGGERLSARVVSYDPRTDLALLAVPGMEARAVSLATPGVGAAVTLFGGLASGTVEGRVTGVVTIGIEEVLGTARVARAGLQLELPARVGDSGAGLFDEDRKLVGVVFAVDADPSGTAWATAADELISLLAQPPGEWACDPERSRLVAVDQD